MYLTYYTTFDFVNSSTNKPHQRSCFLFSLTLPPTSSAFSFLCIDSLRAPTLLLSSLLFCTSRHPHPPRLQRHHLYLYKKYRGGSAIRPLKGSYFAERFTASLTLREKDVGITQVYEWFLRLALLYIERWIKDWQDLPLHQTRILTSEGKCSKQWRGIEALHCLYPRSFFLSAGSESSLRPSHYWRQSFPE